MNATTDWYGVEELTDTSLRIHTRNATLFTTVYAVSGEERTVVIDAALGVGDLVGLLEDRVGGDLQCVLTHSHWDHIGNAAQFEDVSIHRRELGEGGRVAIDTLTDEFVDRPAEFVAAMREAGRSFPDGFDPDTFGIPPATGVTALEEGDVIDLGGRELEVVALPGHSPGHVGLLDRTEEVLYGGDLPHLEHGLYLHFRDCDLETCRESLERIRRLRDDGAFGTLATAHNAPYTGADLSIVDALADGLAEIAAGEREYETVETNYGPARAYDIEGSRVLTKLDPLA